MTHLLKFKILCNYPSEYWSQWNGGDCLKEFHLAELNLWNLKWPFDLCLLTRLHVNWYSSFFLIYKLILRHNKLFPDKKISFLFLFLSDLSLHVTILKYRESIRKNHTVHDPQNLSEKKYLKYSSWVYIDIEKIRCTTKVNMTNNEILKNLHASCCCTFHTYDKSCPFLKTMTISVEEYIFLFVAEISELELFRCLRVFATTLPVYQRQ